MEAFKNGGTEHNGYEEVTTIDKEVVIDTEVALRTPELLQVKWEVTSLNKL